MNSRQDARAQSPRKSGGKSSPGNGSNSLVSSKTEGKIAEAKIKPSTMAEMALLQAPAAVVVCDTHQKITLANEIARQMAQTDPCGQSMKSVQKIWGEIVDVRGCCVPLEEWPWVRALDGETIACEEIEFVGQNGKSFHVQLSAAPIRLAKGGIVGAVTIFADISNLKLQELNRQYEMLIGERTRIAGNIHDNVSQGLNGSILNLRAARKEIANLVRFTRTHLAKAIEASMYSLAEARRATSMFSYHFAQTDDPALDLRHLAQQLFAGLSVEVEFSLQSPTAIVPSGAHLELLRIGKEALTNVVKHARASMVGITLEYGQHNVVLKVFDNGCGFTLAPSSEVKEGFGLLSMQLRARQIGGNVRIESQPGRGTSVIAVFPI